MKTLATVLLALAMAASLIAQNASRNLSSGEARKLAKEQVEFGIDLAQRTLWRDDMQHFSRAVQIDPSYAEAWNNLAIGYEQLGKLEEARDAYDAELKLQPNNQFMLNNYASFREIYDRQNVRGGGGR